MTEQAAISCRNLWKIFGADPLGFLARCNHAPGEEDFRREGYIGAVRDVSFEVRAGEILIIMGLSGSGKSTLIRALSRLNDPTAGQILLGGKDLLKATQQELIELRRHKMGMVFQHFGLLPHRSVLENVAFPLEVRGTPREERERHAKEMLKLVGLEGTRILFSARTVRRATATCRHRALPCRWARHLVPGRAILCARSPDPARDAGRVPAPAAYAAQDHRLHHA